MTKPSLRARLPALAGALVLIAVLAGALAESASATGVRYFVVAENPSTFDPCFHCDSYILPLSDPEDIAEAREIIARGGTGLGTIVVAKIVAGSDGINRDVLAPGEPLWSWHVTEFGLFADGVIEILEGWPGGWRWTWRGGSGTPAAAGTSGWSASPNTPWSKSSPSQSPRPGRPSWPPAQRCSRSAGGEGGARPDRPCGVAPG